MAGNVVNNKRSCLHPDVNMLIFCTKISNSEAV